MRIHGLDLEQVRRRVGTLSQIARIDSFIEADGPARGARRLRVITGGGLEFDVHPDRCLDIGQVTIDGVPLAWMAADGIAAPGLFDPRGAEWLRTFGGGFVTTCGLDTFGPATVDEGREYGQHGRISAAPASMVRASVDDGMLVVEAVMRQSILHGENLTLRRRIEAAVGSTTFAIHDVVTNERSQPVAHMLMYHANMGWPLVEEGATLSVPSTAVVGRDELSAAGLDAWGSFESPTTGRGEEVFMHSFDPGSATRVSLVNPRLGISVDLDYDRTQLPWLCEWKFMSDDTYVVGIEPVNCPTFAGRAGARAEGTLPFLQAGQSAHYDLAFTLGRGR